VTSVAVVNDKPVAKIATKLPTQPVPGTAPAPGVPAVMPGAPAAGQSSEVKTQEERVIAGREVVKVVLDVDVYRFIETQEAKL
jgi:hypothetical protein